MSFIDGKPFRVTREHLGWKWYGRNDSSALRCAWCGHRFAEGDVVRCIYTNGRGDETKGISGNPFVCEVCDCPRDELLAQLRAMAEESRTKFWWFTER